MAASLRKKMELARLAFPVSDLPPTPDDGADNASTALDKPDANFRHLNDTTGSYLHTGTGTISISATLLVSSSTPTVT
jgi:hypothetical protein